MSNQSAIWWIRRDLRLHDNPALHAARTSSTEIIPVFVLDPRLLNSRFTGSRRIAFLCAGLHSLDEQLRLIGGRLIVRAGYPEHILPRLVGESNANRIYAEADFSPFARLRDATVASSAPLKLIDQPSVTHPSSVLKHDGQPYRVFTPYARRWRQVIDYVPELLSAPRRIRVPELNTETLPETSQLSRSVALVAGESAARARLKEFTTGDDAGVYRYRTDRDRMDLDGTSRLSPYLRFGMISPRAAVAAAMNAIHEASTAAHRESAEAWLNELIWREYYLSIMYHFPDVLKQEFQEKFRGMEWINDDEDFAAWTSAQTGYPIVDASMRQLESEGWMHNRGRMITASFLIKHLLVDWRWGEQHFMRHLIDGDPASNNGGWQWSAGTGTDAAPYFRVFNPTTQARRHDPNGEFIRRWLPELAHVPNRFIHEPWKMSNAEQERAGCRIGAEYPETIVDHQIARRRALAAYGRTGR